MSSHTLKVTGVSEELLQLLDDQIRARHVSGRSEYIRELIRRDVLPTRTNGAAAIPRTFCDLLGPIQEATRQLGETDEETEAFLGEEILAARHERGAKTQSDVR